MIRSDTELGTTQERISRFEGLLAQLRVTATPDEFPLVASGYRVEIERMQQDVLDYLTRHVSEELPAKVA